MENSLIHPTVSTLMFRRECVALLGGWDEVKVGADTELLQRIIALYGQDAVQEVLPGVPLAFGRQLPESLTNASATHLRSRYFGLRRIYQELSQSWHASTSTSAELRLSADSDPRRFRLLAAVSESSSRTEHYDWILMADFGDYATMISHTHALVKQRLSDGQRIALFHWPDYRQPAPAPMAERFLSLAVHGAIDVLLPRQVVSADLLEVFGRHLLEHPLDEIPYVQFRRCRVRELEKPRQILRLPLPTANIHERALIEQSGLFYADWYLHRYPDVKQAGIEPLRHFIENGASEGRDPGPNFDTLHYQSQFTQSVGNSSSPLAHYLTIGAALGYTPTASNCVGKRPLNDAWPTLLLCGHAANEELFGAERSLVDVLQALSMLAVNVVVTVPSNMNTDYVGVLQQLTHSVIFVRCPLWSTESMPCPWTRDRFVEIIREYKVDAVQVNTIMLREPLLAGRQQNIPTLVHVRESLDRDTDLCRAIGLSPEAIRNEVLHQADYILANSAFTGRTFHKPERTYLVGNALDAINFDIPNRLNPEIINIALISSNLPKKGLADFIAIARLLEISTPTARLLLIGPENEYISTMRGEQASGNVPANVVFKGYAASPQDAIRQANIVLNLSHFEETFGRTVLEAMASKRPVLAYAQGAIPELITEGVNGFLLPFGDVQAIADRLHWLCKNPKQIDKLGAAGRRIFMSRFTLERLREELKAMYTATLRLRSPFPETL
jgi:glycosyltransferase involved in cell wall biosynthesis